MWFDRNIENILNRVKNHGPLTAAGVARSLIKTIRGKKTKDMYVANHNKRWNREVNFVWKCMELFKTRSGIEKLTFCEYVWDISVQEVKWRS